MFPMLIIKPLILRWAATEHFSEQMVEFQSPQFFDQSDDSDGSTSGTFLIRTRGYPGYPSYDPRHGHENPKRLAVRPRTATWAGQAQIGSGEIGGPKLLVAYGGFQKWGGTPKWRVYKGKSYENLDDSSIYLSQSFIIFHRMAAFIYLCWLVSFSVGWCHHFCWLNSPFWSTSHVCFWTLWQCNVASWENR